eukprot:TRINITY_DN71018_c0_g1_i1.p1 TRINITY_DN71018_c0_g1~~TRINITY_DN71018_c0_g1_i1.p1  ORF type:complete len:687 (-),score=74.35 TRINITY_DN71018_c0_g1_i1:134-2194(-)
MNRTDGIYALKGASPLGISASVAAACTREPWFAASFRVAPFSSTASVVGAAGFSPFYQRFRAAVAGELPRDVYDFLCGIVLAQLSFVESDCIAAALLALLWKITSGLSRLRSDVSRTFVFDALAWNAEERVWHDVYLPRRPADAFNESTTSWEVWVPWLRNGEAQVASLLADLKSLRENPTVPLRNDLPTAAELLARTPGTACFERNERMTAYERMGIDGDRKLFFDIFRNESSTALSNWQVLFRASPLLPYLVLEVLGTLVWTWSRCAQAVFLALAVQIASKLEHAITKMIAGQPFRRWAPQMSEAQNMLDSLFIPLRPTLLTYWNVWAAPPHWSWALRRAENRIMLHKEVLTKQDMDRAKELQRACGGVSAGGGCAGDGGMAVPFDASAFDRHMEDVFNVVVSTLEELGAEFWPTGGTLIGALRYGRVAGRLMGGKMDSVDDDLEFMVGVRRESDWFVLAYDMERLLGARGLVNCHHQISEPSHVFRPRLRIDTLTCASVRPYAIGIELRSYVIGNGFAYQHALRDIPGCDETNHRRPLPFLCFAFELPFFQTWRGQLPLNLLYPLRPCLLFNRTVRCPAHAIEVLIGWNGGEYDLRSHCLAVPLLTQDRSVVDGRNAELMRRGLEPGDLELLRRYARELHALGFASFLPQWVKGECPELFCLQHNWARGVCPPARARPQDLDI